MRTLVLNTSQLSGTTTLARVLLARCRALREAAISRLQARRMPDETKRRKQIDEQIERAVKGDPKPDKPTGPSAMERAEAKFKREIGRAHV